MADAVVTGGASGIGRALAEALVARGDTVVLADVDPAVGAVATALTEQGPGRATSAVVDVRDADAVRDLVESAYRDHGRLDLVFNNAGIGVGGPVEQLTLDHWNRAIDVNLRGVIHGVHAAYPIMIAQGFGHIVNTASGLGLVAMPMLGPYVTTKHAVVGLSLSLRAEAEAYGVRVSVVCPGVIETPILDKGNPGDLATLEHAVDGRAFLEKLDRPYPAAALAADVLRGIARNDAVITAPRSMTVAALLQRLAPGLVRRRAAQQAAAARAQLGITAESVRRRLLERLPARIG